ncbi:MAG: SPFH domain-containing protein, partial [Oscillospiraceae bacterium]|nr:SPFH domain-containing protein [Oscillospiraceae bacterium]
MGLFNQRRETIEWNESRSDVLFYKWHNDEIKTGSTLVIRAGQNAVFYSGGRVAAVFENAGSFDIDTEIVPVLTDAAAWLQLKKDSGFRAEIYFINTKELTMNWGTRQRIMIPTAEVPSGIPVGMNGNLVVEFRDYQKFIEKVAGVKPTYTLDDIGERIRGELDSIVSDAILNGQTTVGLNALVALQANSRTLGKKMCEELDKEMFDIGLGVRDLNIISVNYPEEVQRMAEKVAGQSFIQDAAKYATVAAADGMENGGGGVAGLGAQMAIGAQIAQQMTGAQTP